MWSIFCSDQLDGLAAAAIILRAAHLRRVPCKVGGVLARDSLSGFAKVLQGERGSSVFVVDVSPDDVPDLVSLGSSGATVAYWCCNQHVSQAGQDVLKSGARVVDLVSPVVSCSADLVLKRFLPGDPVAITLARLAADFEFWLRKDERAVKLADLFASGYDGKQLVDALSKGVFWTDAWESRRLEYVVRKQAALDDMMTGLIIREVSGMRLGFSLASSLLREDDASRFVLERHDGVDVAVVLFRDGRISFRTRDGVAFDSIAAGNAFGGSGAGSVGHGNVRDVAQHVTLERLQDVIYAVQQRLVSALSKTG